MGAAGPAATSRGGGLPRRTNTGTADQLKALSIQGRQERRKAATSLGPAGMPAPDDIKAFSPARALETANRLDCLSRGGGQVADEDALNRGLDGAATLRARLSPCGGSPRAGGEASTLARLRTELENLEGLAIKGARRSAAYRPPRPVPYSGGLALGAVLQRAQPEGGTTKTNTGWILDRHVLDPEGYKTYPTLNYDYKHYEEGQSDIAMGHSDHPSSTSMFGWVWQVQSFFWTDTTLVPNHANPSYCLFVQVSYDGGFTWLLYEILYDPTGTGHTTSLDMINPKLAMDITGTYDRYFIAYEYCKSASDHDVYVYSETSELDGGTASPQDIGVGISTNMERNPAIASDYKTGETSYRVLAYEYAYSATDYDLYAAQSTGDGSAWTTPIGVAETTGMETHPALTAGCTGDGDAVPFSATMHLAYNHETWGTGTAQILLNPGFEGGHTDWVESRPTIIDNTATHEPRTGDYKAWLGGTNNANDTLYQTLTIPAGATAAQLSFYLRMVSTEGTTTAYDYLYIRVRDTAGALLATLGTITNRDQNTYANYTLVSYSMDAYIGQEARVSFEATTDGSEVTSFLVDDTGLDAGEPQLTGAEIRYKGAPHPGATAYPDGLASSSPIAVLASIGGTPAWAYGPPAIAASHGGSETVPGGRVIVAADQLFPEDQPTAGDPERYQLIYAVNMCNGGTICGDILGCAPAVSLGWNAYYFDDPAADYRFPSFVADGGGWVEGTSGVPQNGVAVWPEIFIAYYHRDLNSTDEFGSVQMLVGDASDELCTGFASGAWYWLTASPRASDDDDRVVAKRGTIAAFNYFYGWPGVCFNKNIWHVGAGYNDDSYFTTLGDNYVIDTLSSGAHITAYWDFYGTTYFGPWTYPWPAGYQMTLTADATASDGGRNYVFSSWTTGDKTTELTVLTDYCGYAGSCPETTINALYSEVGVTPLRVPYTSTPTTAATSDHGASMTVTWDGGNCTSANYHIVYGRGENLPSWTLEGGECTLGTMGTYAWAAVPDPSAYTSRFLWFLVVGDDGASTEGSWGLTYPGGSEEGGTAASGVCGMTVKNLSGICGTP
jgi:hypothetical protein